MRYSICLATLLGAGLCLITNPAPAQTRAQQNTGEHWVATWGTALPLIPPIPGGRGARGGSGPGTAPNAPNAAAPNTATNAPTSNGPPNAQPAANQAQGGRGRRGGRGPSAPPTFDDQTVRMIVRASLGGQRLRVELSNMMSAQPVEVGAAHIGLHKGDGVIVAGSDRALTFGGSASFTMQPGMLVVSDPVDLEVAPLAELAVSLYLPHDTGMPTTHLLGLHTAYISKGNMTGAGTMPEPTNMTSYTWLSGVDVLAPADAYTVVAFGDSITDGQGSTRDRDKMWAGVLAARLNANKATRHVAVINEGIGGNQVLRDAFGAAGVAALSRLDRDVFARPGVKLVILLEGINDMTIRGGTDAPGALTAEEMIWGYRELIARCHEHGIKVVGATVTPDRGIRMSTERGEGIRQKVNEWIRAKGNFDAFVDFDAAIRDPQNPTLVKAEFDSGDHIHPSDAGYEVMGNAIDLRLFGK